MAWPLTLGAISFFLAVVWGAPLIRLLKSQRLGKQIRIEEPTKHQIKTGTPTMGGVMVIVPVVLITAVLNIANLLGNTLIGRSVLVPIGTLLLFGTTEFIGHLPVYGVFLTLLVYGSNPATTPAVSWLPRLGRPVPRRSFRKSREVVTDAA